MKLPKLGQDVTCELPGYEGVTASVWVNVPQGIIETWEAMREEAIVKDEQGRPVPLLDDKGEVVTDPDSFEPMMKVDQDKLMEASRYFMTNLLLDFSVTEDMDGKPLSVSDADFLMRVPEDLISWLYASILESLKERRNQGKSGAVRLAGITGR